MCFFIPFIVIYRYNYSRYICFIIFVVLIWLNNFNYSVNSFYLLILLSFLNFINYYITSGEVSPQSPGHICTEYKIKKLETCKRFEQSLRLRIRDHKKFILTKMRVKRPSPRSIKIRKQDQALSLPGIFSEARDRL